MGDPARERLRRSWAWWFRRELLPILLRNESLFSGLYGAKGRPNWSVARMLGVCLLQQFEDLDDQAALDALSFDARWQYALDLAREDAYLSRRSLVDFRGRLVVHDSEGVLMRQVFDEVCEAGLADLKLSTVHQRLDSTLITSAIRRRGRLSLARETLRVFLGSLERDAYERVSDAIRAWHAADEGWERHVAGAEATSALQELGGWVRELVDQFSGDTRVRATEPYELLVRLLREHAVALGQVAPASDPDSDSDSDPDSGPGSDSDPDSDSDPGPDSDSDSDSERRMAPSASAERKAKRKQRAKKNRAKTGKARFWSPHDPDASCGHKGLGYHAHFTETCRNETTELLTDYDVVTAADTDVGRAMPVIERLAQRGRPAVELYADGGYPTPAQLLAARAAGTELYAPVHRGKLSDDVFARTDFAWDGDRVVACPAGQQPTRHGQRASDTAARRRSLHVFFDADTCGACAERTRCPVRQPNNKRSREYRLDIADELVARDQRWADQKTESWRAQYRIRAGVEATMSELKRAHGLGRLRVRRLPRVRLQVAFKAIACNIKRWARAVARPAGLAACAIALVLAAWRRPPDPVPSPHAIL